MEISKEKQQIFEELEVQLRIYPEDAIQEFIKIDDLYDYIVNEAKFWRACTEGHCNSIRGFFQSLQNELDSIIKTPDINNFTVQIKSLVNKLNKSAFPCIYSTTTHSIEILKLYNKHPNSANGFIDYIRRMVTGSLTDFNFYLGWQQGYSFENPNPNSSITESNEQKLNELSSKYRSDIGRLNKLYEEDKKSLDESNKQIIDNMLEWQSLNKGSLEALLKEKNEKLESLENVYQENLRLKAPAQHWKDLEDHYEKKGDIWRRWTIGAFIIVMALLIVIFFELPSVFLMDTSFLTFNSLRSTVVLAVIIALGVYLIKLFVKLSMSAYHLSRDAKERFELTSFYLSLINEAAIAPEDRNIVLQALFSRADTGLLKGDSSPTLPDGLLSQIMKLVK